MLVAGRSDPQLGDGNVVEPMRLVLGDRASSPLSKSRGGCQSHGDSPRSSIGPDSRRRFRGPIRCNRDGTFKRTTVAPVAFVPMTGTALKK